MQRILRPRIGLIWLLLLVCVLITAADPLTRLPWLAGGSALFVLSFRLWDDLADLEHDRRHHPGRHLTRTPDIHAFHTLLWLLITTLAGLLLWLEDKGRALAFVGLVAVFFVCYHATADHPRWRNLRVALVLTKYPAWVMLLAREPSHLVALLTAFGVYLPPLLDEVRSTGQRVLLPAAACVGLTLLFWLTLT